MAEDPLQAVQRHVGALGGVVLATGLPTGVWCVSAPREAGKPPVVITAHTLAEACDIWLTGADAAQGQGEADPGRSEAPPAPKPKLVLKRRT